MTAKRSNSSMARVLPAALLDVHDGDTVRLLVDFGGDVFWRPSVRLLGGNARELSEDGGHEAGDHLRTLLAPVTPKSIADLWDMPITLTSVAWDKYGGRIDGYLATPGIPDVMTQMIRDGFAAPWDGKGKAPVPVWPPTTGPW